MTTNDTKSTSVSRAKDEIQQSPALNLNWPKRYLCSAASDARNLLEPWIQGAPNENSIRVSKGALICVLTLVNEMQVYGQRMEEALDDYKDFEDMKKRYKEMQTDVKNFEAWKAQQSGKKKGWFSK